MNVVKRNQFLFGSGLSETGVDAKQGSDLRERRGSSLYTGARPCRVRLMLFGALSAGMVIGCGAFDPEKLPPLGQVVLHVTTDAPLPPPPGIQNLPDLPTALFDRLRIEALHRDGTAACADCAREFGVDREMVANGRASMGILPPIASPSFLIRIRLFPSSLTQQDDPIENAMLETVIGLPAVGAEGVTDVSVVLRMEDLSHPRGTVQVPEPPTLGMPPADVAGSWKESRRVACNEAPQPDEVCVPGGAFWMGSMRTVEGADDPRVFMPRLVILSPFFIMAHETTVQQLRDSGMALADPVSGLSADPIESTSADGSSRPNPSDWCTFRTSAGGSDAFPVNCISPGVANSYCRSRGAEVSLPTEAQLAYVASGLGEHLYVWGEDQPSCAEAVYARGGVGRWMNAPGFCRTDSIGGPVRRVGGQVEDNRDRLMLPRGAVHDLAGNLAELAKDSWAEWGTSCWEPRVLRDPVCGQATNASSWVVRGGSWLSGPYELRAMTRTAMTKDLAQQVYGPTIGFRCARPSH